VKSIFY